MKSKASAWEFRMRFRQRTPARGGRSLLISVAMLSVAHAAPLETEEPNLDAKLGGVTAIHLVVDTRPAGIAAIKVQKSAIQDQVRKSLRSSNVRLITEEDALKSMHGVAVLHLAVNALVDDKAQVAAFKVDVECLRPAVVDRRKYTPTVIVWRTGGIGLFPVKEAEQAILKAVDDYVAAFIAKLQAASGSSSR